MDKLKYLFYECDNPGCGLRFPGYVGHPRWNRCPRCRGKIQEVEQVGTSSENNETVTDPGRFSIEVILDNLRSAYNVGSIIRTSDGLGIQKIYCCGITPSPVNPKVIKTSLGAESFLKWEYHPNGLSIALALKSSGFVLWALEDVIQAESLYQISFSPNGSPLVLIIGNEITGVDPGILRICDKIVRIPMFGRKKSFNAAIAFGIAASIIQFQLSD